jgi:uncharacterized protein YcfL
MKKFLIPIFLVFCFTGCEESDEVSVNSPLMSCYARHLDFEDNHLFGDARIVYPPPDSGMNQIAFQYDENRIVRVTGGFDFVPGGSNYMGNLLFTTHMYDSIVHQGNAAYVYTRPQRSYNLMNDQPENPIIYETNERGYLKKVIRRSGETFYYAWYDDQILEMNPNEETIRTFYMGGGNLIRIEAITTRDNGEPWQKKEMVFTGYDQAPNPLNKKYHILGAFYRAFSRNNYSSITTHKYLWEKGSWAWQSSYSREVSMQYTPQGQPLLGEYANH